jgi:tetratricopeptide (TPR) repeat protein
MRSLLLSAIAVGLLAPASTAATGATRQDAKSADKAELDDPESAEQARTAVAALGVGDGDKEERLARVEELSAIAPTPIETLRTFLARERKTPVEDRRAVLESINADLPDEKGRFRSPGREKPEDLEAAEKLDWAAELSGKPASPALGEALADIAAIRALARSEDPRGALIVLEFAFADAGLIYRDECGRYLRLGAPWSIPGLIRGTDGDRLDMRRYASYQLERLDREAPHKALRAARGNEVLQVEIFRAYADSLFREAIYLVLDSLDHGSPPIRAAARDAWHRYITTAPRRPVPKRKLTLPGGDLTKKPMPLYLSHLEIADIEIRERLEAITGEAPPKKATLEEMSEKLLAEHDRARAARDSERFARGQKAAAAGDHAEAVRLFDAVLATSPDHPKRREMAPSYLAQGEALLEARDFQGAAVRFRKASALDPEGPSAKEARAKIHVARARAIEAAGGDSSAELARARDIDPEAGMGEAPGRWMLFIGVGGAVAGLLLLLAGVLLRRR